jgi:hypothetical protein
MTNLAGETIDARCVGCIYIYICCTTGFKIELPNARAEVCLVTDHLIYQPARRLCSLQAELIHVI